MTTKISGANISSIGNTGLNWQAVTVADGSTTVNATSGNGYLLDTNAGVIEVFLPTSPTRGDTVVLADYSGTFATNQCIVNTGGINIDSTVGSDFKLTTNNTIAEFVYIDSAKGWLVKLNQAAGTTPSSALTLGNVYDLDAGFIIATGGTITTSGDYKIHTFTGDGCFTVSSLGSGATPCAEASTVDYLVVAGGGSGNYMGAGGAGGYRESKDSTLSSPHTASPLAATTGITVTATTYPITVGAGGTKTTNPVGPVCGSKGSNSIFSTITSTGGGGGGYGGAQPISNGTSGGSGGGGSYGNSPGGSGNTPPTSPSQGNSGGQGLDAGAVNESGGGGGGATQAGSNAPGPGSAGPGGAGAGTGINPSPCVGTPGPCGSIRYFAGGGGGNTDGSGAGGVAGTGGGGTGTINGGPGGSRPQIATAGTANTGGGGGGGSGPDTTSGGKGIVIIRYKYQ